MMKRTNWKSQFEQLEPKYTDLEKKYYDLTKKYSEAMNELSNKTKRLTHLEAISSEKDQKITTLRHKEQVYKDQLNRFIIQLDDLKASLLYLESILDSKSRRVIMFVVRLLVSLRKRLLILKYKIKDKYKKIRKWIKSRSLFQLKTTGNLPLNV